MLRAWWAECKLYVFGFLLIVAGIAYWYHVGTVIAAFAGFVAAIAGSINHLFGK